MSDRGLTLAVFLGTLGLFVRGVAPSVTAGDSGEFVTAAATLSLAHSPSFPLYALLGHAFMSLVPLGALALRANWFSAVVMAAAAALLFRLARALGAGRAGAVAVAVAAVTAEAAWSNALVTEVFALNTLFAVVLLLVCARIADRDPRPWDVFGAFLAGFAAGNHQVIVVAAPAVAAAVVLAQGWSFLARRLWAYVLFGFLGLSIYAFLPIRAAKTPPLNWGQPTTAAKFTHSFLRRDYGSLNLAPGEAPERNAANAVRHLGRFVRHLTHEAPAPVLLLGLAGLVLGWRARRPFYAAVAVLFVLSGPAFAWLGNLPFTFQSDGIAGRFLLLPALCLLLGLAEWARRWKWGAAVAGLCAVTLLAKGYAEAAAHRHSTAILDYGRALLRSLPPGAALFMDGGDDAFYSLAVLHLVEGRRPDVRLHDRGGLVFPNPYGEDFRRLPREQKAARRAQIERAVLAERPLFYSTMDKDPLPGVAMRPVGFLFEAGDRGGVRYTWPLAILRSIYPAEPSDYRTRALACFFPYMRGREALAAGRVSEGLAWTRRALIVGFDVDWLRTNVAYDYAHAGYAALTSGRAAEALEIYRQWSAADPDDHQAQANLGVALERVGRLEEARAQYRRAASRFPGMADPVFNLAVLAWRDQDWKEAARLLEETLRRSPDHAQALNLLPRVRERLEVAR